MCMAGINLFVTRNGLNVTVSGIDFLLFHVDTIDLNFSIEPYKKLRDRYCEDTGPAAVLVVITNPVKTGNSIKLFGYYNKLRRTYILQI